MTGNFDIRQVVVPIVGDIEGAVPLPDGWEPLQAERRGGELVLLCKRERTAAPLEGEATP